jgi:hypothetical protein
MRTKRTTSDVANEMLIASPSNMDFCCSDLVGVANVDVAGLGVDDAIGVSIREAGVVKIAEGTRSWGVDPVATRMSDGRTQTSPSWDAIKTRRNWRRMTAGWSSRRIENSKLGGENLCIHTVGWWG